MAHHVAGCRDAPGSLGEAATQREHNEKMIPKHHKLKKSWIWDKEVEDFVRQRIQGHSLNVPAGKSKLGDVRGDIDPQDPGVIKVEMNALPFPDETFDTVVQDPPWKIGFYQRMKPFFECVRVCKQGGTIIYNAYWIPQSKDVELIEIYIRQDSPWANTSIISVFRKKSHGEDLNNYLE